MKLCEGLGRVDQVLGLLALRQNFRATAATIYTRDRDEKQRAKSQEFAVNRRECRAKV